MKYDHLEIREDGRVFHRLSRGSARAGQEFGCVNKEGYRQGKIEGKTVLTHRLVFYHHTGEWPSIIDHIDGNRLNNRIQNLRAVSHAQNTRNSVKKWGSTSKYRGVVFTKGRWKCSCSLDGRRIQLYFKTEIEAAEAYIELRNRLHGEIPIQELRL